MAGSGLPAWSRQAAARPARPRCEGQVQGGRANSRTRPIPALGHRQLPGRTQIAW